LSYLPKEGYKRIAVIFMYIVIGALAFKYLLPPMLPFIIAWIAALVLRPLVKGFSRITKVPYKASSVFILAIALLTVGSGLYHGAKRVVE